MHTQSLEPWQHHHVFGQDRPHGGERRVLLVAVLTAVMMVVEIVGGIAFGSMALLADGLHMGSHFAALSIAYVAYVYARRHATDHRFSFGTGKINALAGYSSALLLALFALVMAAESAERLLAPVPIAFSDALLVAVVGLVVNGVSALLLGHREDDDHAGHGHQPGHTHAGHHAHDHTSQQGKDHHHDHEQARPHDHNLRGAYLHVIADALTSVLAILALLGGKYFGWSWLDATIGIVGAVMVGHWALGLLRSSGFVLLDREMEESVTATVRAAIESDDTRVADLHLWSVGTAGYAAALSVVSEQPLTAEDYKRRLPPAARIVHATVEVHRCPGDADKAQCLDREGN